MFKALQRLFSNFNVVSVRVLRNSSGFSRGIGFVRFADRAQAQMAIDTFNGQSVPSHLVYDSATFALPPAPLSLRFAREKLQH